MNFKQSYSKMDDPCDTEGNELSVQECAFWHINMDLYYGYQVGEIVEVEHEPNKYWLATIYYSFKHLVLLRWIGEYGEFWVDTSTSGFLQSSSSFNPDHASPRRLYPLGYHSQFHTRSQFDLVKPTKFLEKPTLYNPACDPYGEIRTVDDLLAHESEASDQNCVFRTPGKLSEPMDLVIANRNAKVTFGQEDAEELAAALQNLDAIDGLVNKDPEKSATNELNESIDENKQLKVDYSEEQQKLCTNPQKLDTPVENDGTKCLNEVTNGQSIMKLDEKENKPIEVEKTLATLDKENTELCKNLIQSAITTRKYHGLGKNSSQVYHVKPKQLYDLGGANHERVFVPGTLVEVCHIEAVEDRLDVFQWFAFVLRNTGGRLALRWFICDEPKFRQGRLDLKSAHSEFIRDTQDQEQVLEGEELEDDTKLPADLITFSKHFCNPCIQSIASSATGCGRWYRMPLSLRKFIGDTKGASEVEILQTKLTDAVHDERRKSLDKDRPIIDHILDVAQNISPSYLKIEPELNDGEYRQEVLISSPTSTRLLRGYLIRVIKPGVYEIHSEPLVETCEIIKFVYPYDSSYTVLPTSWGTKNKECLSVTPSRAHTPNSLKEPQEVEEPLAGSAPRQMDQKEDNHDQRVDPTNNGVCIEFEVPAVVHWVNDGINTWCAKGRNCQTCVLFKPIESTTNGTSFRCEIDEACRARVTENFKVMDCLEVSHPSSNITICSGRIRKVVYPLLWIQISPESYTLLPFNSTEIYPRMWCKLHGHSSISLLPPRKRCNNRFDDKKRKRQKMSDDSEDEQNQNGCVKRKVEEIDNFDLGKLCDKQINIDYILNEKSKYITIYFNHKCFTGPALSKGKICSLPQYVGPGPLRLVMEEVITKVISVAYVPPRILNDLSSKVFEDLLISRKLTNTTPMEFKAKYQKRVHREDVQVCVDVNDIPLYCECVCEHLKCCYNLFSPELYDGDDCPGHCRALTKSNKFMKRATYYREKARLGEFMSDNSSKKKAASNNITDNSAKSRPTYAGRGSSESTSSSLSRGEQVNSRASSNENDREVLLADQKENLMSEELNNGEEDNGKAVSDRASPSRGLPNDQNHQPMESSELDHDESLSTQKVTTINEEQSSEPQDSTQPQTRTVSRAERWFDEFDRLAIDSDLINQWSINDLEDYLKSGHMDKFVPIVSTEVGF